METIRAEFNELITGELETARARAAASATSIAAGAGASASPTAADRLRDEIIRMRAQVRVIEQQAAERIAAAEAQAAQAASACIVAQSELASERAAAAAAAEAKAGNVFDGLIHANGMPVLYKSDLSSVGLGLDARAQAQAHPAALASELNAHSQAKLAESQAKLERLEITDKERVRLIADLTERAQRLQSERDRALEDALVAQALARDSQAKAAAAEAALIEAKRRAAQQATAAEAREAELSEEVRLWQSEMPSLHHSVSLVAAKANRRTADGASPGKAGHAIDRSKHNTTLGSSQRRARHRDAAVRAKVARTRQQHTRERSRYLTSIARREHVGVSDLSFVVSQSCSDSGSGSASSAGSAGSEPLSGSVDSLVSDLVHEINVEIERTFAIDERAHTAVQLVRTRYASLVTELETRLDALHAELTRARAHIAMLELEQPIFGVVSINGRRDVPFRLAEVSEATFRLEFALPPGPCVLVLTNHASRAPLTDASSGARSPTQPGTPVAASTPPATPSRSLPVTPSRSRVVSLDSVLKSAAASVAAVGATAASAAAGALAAPAASESAMPPSPLSSIGFLSNATLGSAVSSYTDIAPAVAPPPAVSAAAAERERFIARERARMSKPSLGLSVVTTSTVKIGVSVAAVEPRGPADEAGLRPGDIIVALAGADVRGRADFRALLSRYVQPEVPVPVVFVRGGVAVHAMLTPARKARTLQELRDAERGMLGPAAPEAAEHGEQAVFAREKFINSLGAPSGAPKP